MKAEFEKNLKFDVDAAEKDEQPSEEKADKESEMKDGEKKD